MFDLPAVFEVLAEHPVVVAQAVTVGGVVEGCQRIEEAGREAAETAVAETGIGLLFDDGVEVEAEHLHRLAGGGEEAGGDQVVAHQPAQEVLHRQVVDHLRPSLVVGAAGDDLAVDDRLADSAAEGDQVIGRARVAQLETAGVSEIVEKAIFELFSRRLFELDFRKHGPPSQGKNLTQRAEFEFRNSEFGMPPARPRWQNPQLSVLNSQFPFAHPCPPGTWVRMQN